MRKMEFMRYTGTQLIALCSDLYKKEKIKNFTVKVEYNNVIVRVRDFITTDIHFYHTGKIVFRQYFHDGSRFDKDYYIWEETTANENVAKKLKTYFRKYLMSEEKATIQYIEQEV